jgi:hypothetical protein
MNGGEEESPTVPCMWAVGRAASGRPWLALINGRMLLGSTESMAPRAARPPAPASLSGAKHCRGRRRAVVSPSRACGVLERARCGAEPRGRVLPASRPIAGRGRAQEREDPCTVAAMCPGGVPKRATSWGQNSRDVAGLGAGRTCSDGSPSFAVAAVKKQAPLYCT